MPKTLQLKLKKMEKEEEIKILEKELEKNQTKYEQLGFYVGWLKSQISVLKIQLDIKSLQRSKEVEEQ